MTKCRFCPIALAIKEKMGPMRGFGVGGSLFVYEENGVEIRFELPKTAQRFITKFDAGQKVKPFTFIARQYVPI